MNIPKNIMTPEEFIKLFSSIDKIDENIKNIFIKSNNYLENISYKRNIIIHHNIQFNSSNFYQIIDILYRTYKVCHYDNFTKSMGLSPGCIPTIAIVNLTQNTMFSFYIKYFCDQSKLFKFEQVNNDIYLTHNDCIVRLQWVKSAAAFFGASFFGVVSFDQNIDIRLLLLAIKRLNDKSSQNNNFCFTSSVIDEDYLGENDLSEIYARMTNYGIHHIRYIDSNPSAEVINKYFY